MLINAELGSNDKAQVFNLSMSISKSRTHTQPNRTHLILRYVFTSFKNEQWTLKWQCDWAPSGMGKPRGLQPCGNCFTYTVCTERRRTTELFMCLLHCAMPAVLRAALSTDYYYNAIWNGERINCGINKDIHSVYSTKEYRWVYKWNTQQACQQALLMCSTVI